MGNAWLLGEGFSDPRRARSASHAVDVEVERLFVSDVLIGHHFNVRLPVQGKVKREVKEKVKGRVERRWSHHDRLLGSDDLAAVRVGALGWVERTGTLVHRLQFDPGGLQFNNLGIEFIEMPPQ